MPANLVVQVITIPLWRNNNNNRTGTALQNIGWQSICLVHFVYTNNRRMSVIFWLIAWNCTGIFLLSSSFICGTAPLPHPSDIFKGICPVKVAQHRWFLLCGELEELLEPQRQVHGRCCLPALEPLSRFASYSSNQEEHDPSPTNPSSVNLMHLRAF